MKAFRLFTKEADFGPDMQSTAELYIMVLCSPTPDESQGLTYEVMMTNTPIVNKIKALSKSDAYAVLSEAEHKVLCERIKAWRWGLMSDDLLGAISAVLDAPTVKLKEVDSECPAPGS